MIGCPLENHPGHKNLHTPNAKKTLSAGNESFRDMIENHRYYVDKPPYIKPLMESGSVVQLITRPRRFGKTLKK